MSDKVGYVSLDAALRRAFRESPVLAIGLALRRGVIRFRKPKVRVIPCQGCWEEAHNRHAPSDYFDPLPFRCPRWAAKRLRRLRAIWPGLLNPSSPAVIANAKARGYA